MIIDYLQELFRVQGHYGLRPIAETDVDIEVDGFDPNNCKVTIQLAAAEDELARMGYLDLPMVQIGKTEEECLQKGTCTFLLGHLPINCCI